MFNCFSSKKKQGSRPPSDETKNPFLSAETPFLSLQEWVNLLPRITVGIITYNCGNENLPAPAVLELQKEIIRLDADILFFSFQEAKLSIKLRESLVTRLLKGRPNQPQTYTELAYKDIYTPTHLHPKYKTEALFNYGNWSRAKVAIAYKNARFPESNPIATPFNQLTTWDPRYFRFDRKGGMYNSLLFPNLGDFKINVIGAHLDSENYVRGQEQAEKLIALAHQNLLSGVTFIAGDLNIRIHPEYIKPKHRTRSNTAPFNDLLATNIDKAIQGSITRWQQDSSILKRVVFAPVNETTYCHTDENEHITYSASRKTYNFGALDLAGYTVSPNSRTTVIHQPDPARVVAPIHPDSGKYVSDHKAVVTKYTVLPEITPEAQARLKASFAVTPLDEIHRILVDANHPDLIRTYFEFAHEATTPIDDATSFYHRTDMNEIKQDITFIIDHLDALFDRDVDPEFYVRLLFETCKKIEMHCNNTGEFMQARYHQLLETLKCPDDLKYKLLSYFSEWLDTHPSLIQTERQHYYYYFTAENHAIVKRGFFSDNHTKHTEIINGLEFRQR